MFIYGTKHCKNNQLQKRKRPCRISVIKIQIRYNVVCDMDKGSRHV